MEYNPDSPLQIQVKKRKTGIGRRDVRRRKSLQCHVGKEKKEESNFRRREIKRFCKMKKKKKCWNRKKRRTRQEKLEEKQTNWDLKRMES